MGAGFDNAAIVDDGDDVSIADGGEAVGDDDGGSADHDAVEGLLDAFLGLGVEGAGGLVEEEDGGVLDNGSGDGNPLLLASRELHSPFSHLQPCMDFVSTITVCNVKPKALCKNKD